jgi:transposase
MRILELQPHFTTQELSAKLIECTQSYKRVYWQILLSISFNPNKKAEEYAAFLGVTKSKVYKVVELYNLKGRGFIDNIKWGGRRAATTFMSFEAEAELMEDLKIKAKSGKVLVAKHLRKIIEDKVGKPVSDDYIWDLFKRHNWKKKMPRPEHPKKDKTLQEDFKKNSLKYWQPTD